MAILDDVLLSVAPAVLAFLSYFFDLSPLWAALAAATPFLGLAVYVGVKVFRETPMSFEYIGGRGLWRISDLRAW